MRTPETPTGISTTVGALVVVVCCAAPPHLDAAGVNARLAVLALGLLAFSASVVDLCAAAVTVGVAFLLFDGFVVDHQGDLAWHGDPDLVRLAVLAGGALLGLAAGALRLALQNHPNRTPPIPAHPRAPLPRPRPRVEAAATDLREVR
jgi:hypothetical protein